MNEQVLCYIDGKGDARFIQLDASQVDGWLSGHPDCLPVYQFPSSGDRIRIDRQLELDYKLNCAKLKLNKADFGGTFTDPASGRTYILLGLRPRNTKYKIVMRDEATRRYVQATLGWFQSLKPAAGTSG